MKRLFMVDYREDGISKHECIEAIQNYKGTDAAMVAVCHAYIGINNELDCVTEVLADMSAKDLNRISDAPESLFLPHRLLYANVEEIKRCALILNKKRED